MGVDLSCLSCKAFVVFAAVFGLAPGQHRIGFCFFFQKNDITAFIRVSNISASFVISVCVTRPLTKMCMCVFVCVVEREKERYRLALLITIYNSGIFLCVTAATVLSILELGKVHPDRSICLVRFYF